MDVPPDVVREMLSLGWIFLAALAALLSVIFYSFRIAEVLLRIRRFLKDR